ncbi:MAG TPA: 3-oxoadipate enol-lactonase [Rhodocyclaceae bacterium]
MQTVRANGLDFRCDIQGSGPWLTLAHSLAADLSMWDAQMEALTPHFTVLRYDLRGHGGSSVPPAPYSFEMLVADQLALWDALSIARSHFLGLSMGGMLGQHLALGAPQRIERLVLASTSSGKGVNPEALAKLWEQRLAQVAAEGMQAMVEPTLGRWFTEPFRYTEPEVMAQIGAAIAATPPAGYAACGRMIPSMDTDGSLPQIVLPTLVLVGEEDAGTPPAMAESIAARIPGARLEVLPQASHLANVEQADLFNALLLAFLGVV